MVRHAGRMMVGTLASRVLGLLREVLTAALFGATRQLDAFFVAYTLANLSRQLLAEGALSASFVPVFSRTLTSEGKEGAHRLARQVLSVLLAATGAVVLLGIALSPLLVRVMAPGFSDADRELAVTLTRMTFPFLMLVSVGALAMGVLNSMDCFFVPAVAPAASNLAFIFFLLLALPDPTVYKVVQAVLLGGACHMLLQWGWCWKLGMRLVPARPDPKNESLRKMLWLFLPYAAGLSLNQVNPVISRMLGSFLEGGAISVLTYADRVLQLPLGLFVIAISQAVLPMLSRIDEGDRAGFRDFIRDALRFNLFGVLPISVGILMLARPAIHLLFVRGAFDDWAWNATASALAVYGIGLPGMACNTVLMRALYARSLPREAVRVTLLTVLLNLVLSLALMPMFSYVGLALASSLAFLGAAFFAAWQLSRNLGLKLDIFDVGWFRRSLAACASMALFIAAWQILFAYPVSGALIARAGWIAGVIVGSIIVFFTVTRALRCPEWAWIRSAFARRGK